LTHFFQCFGCKQTLEPGQQFVTVANPGSNDSGQKFHLACFTCNYCNRPIEHGHPSEANLREFYILGETKYCLACYPRIGARVNAVQEHTMARQQQQTNVPPVGNQGPGALKIKAKKPKIKTNQQDKQYKY